MNGKFLYILIAIMLVVTLGLGYALYSFGYESPTPIREQTNGVQGRTSEESKILNTPKSFWTAKQKNEYQKYVLEKGVQTQTVSISGCRSTPLVIKIRDNTSFFVQNEDTVTHYLALDKKHVFEIPPGKKEISTVFSRGPGIYGYACDSAKSATGIFVVTN